MNDTSPQLEIPTASVHALIDLNDDWDDDSELRRALRDIAAPVVAAELRRLAGVFIAAECRDEAAVLLGRVGELDPQGRRVVQAADSWFAPAIPVAPPTGEVRVRRARPDEPDDV